MFYDAPLMVETYDAFNRDHLPAIAGDVDFYAEMAAKAGGPALEVACGTGRITLPLAERGIEIVGVDLSEAMLAHARSKAESLPAARRPTLLQQDMCALELDRAFGLIFVPFRSFQHLLTIERQRQALAAILRHLRPDGRLVLHLFDPRLDILSDATFLPPPSSGTGPDGKRYRGELVSARFDHLAQIRYDLWRYSEESPDGQLLRREEREMTLRWTYRWELHHLLALSGFSIEAEYSDFHRTPPAYGKELIVVASPTQAGE